MGFFSRLITHFFSNSLFYFVYVLIFVQVTASELFLECLTASRMEIFLMETESSVKTKVYCVNL